MEDNGFKIKFDKNTIDHLGIKLYSSFPPVIAELISNSYDADAENVEIKINYEEKIVTVMDNGTGMTHAELNRNFLVIGRNRRKEEGTGISKLKGRKVTGKKGLGKLAVFGIAKTIEVSGTVVIIKEIKQSTIMGIEDLAYNLSRRFSFYDAEFEVKIVDEKTKKEQIISKSIYFDKLDKEFTWTFPEDFTNEIQNVDEFKRLNEYAVTGKIYTKSTPLRKKESG